MTRLNVSLTESMKAFVEAQEREEKARLEAVLIDGLDSGDPIEVDDAYWDEKRRRYDERHREGDGQ